MKTIKTTYDRMREQVDEILEKRGAKDIWLRFSDFESLDDECVSAVEDWPIEVVDFKEELTPGKVVFLSRHNYKSPIYNNPIWEDVIWEANESILHGMKKCSLDGWDHVFLEVVEFKEEKNGVKYYEMWFGS